VKCSTCKRNIAAGAEAQKMIVEYVQTDGSTLIFGYMMTDGSLSEATGRLLRAWHHKHYHVERKREARGDALTGRVVAGGPNAYDFAESALSHEESYALGLDPSNENLAATAHLGRRLDRLREVARRVGKAVGDLTVMEAFWAEENGSPYEHGHHLRLENYQLFAHLLYAHGVPGDATITNVQAEHDRLHAVMKQQAIVALREADATTESLTRDWREQFTAELREGSHG
jgi:hypothetical protein